VQVGDGGGFPSLFLGPAVKRKGQRNGGRRRRCGGKKSKLPPPRIYTEEARVVGIMGVFHYPDRFCGESPRGGAEWGGGSCNRATRP
jgi:hypothetical protein